MVTALPGRGFLAALPTMAAFLDCAHPRRRCPKQKDTYFRDEHAVLHAIFSPMGQGLIEELMRTWCPQVLTYPLKIAGRILSVTEDAPVVCPRGSFRYSHHGGGRVRPFGVLHNKSLWPLDFSHDARHDAPDSAVLSAARIAFRGGDRYRFIVPDEVHARWGIRGYRSLFHPDVLALLFSSRALSEPWLGCVHIIYLEIVCRNAYLDTCSAIAFIIALARVDKRRHRAEIMMLRLVLGALALRRKRLSVVGRGDGEAADAVVTAAPGTGSEQVVVTAQRDQSRGDGEATGIDPWRHYRPYGWRDDRPQWWQKKEWQKKSKKRKVPRASR